MDELDLKIDHQVTEREEILEKEKLIDAEIEKKTKIFKEKKELLAEIERLENSDIGQLEAEVTKAQEELDSLK